MRRLLRILLNAATAVSLVLCVATVALWVRSYWGAPELAYSAHLAADDFGLDASVQRGTIILWCYRGPSYNRRRLDWGRETNSPFGSDPFEFPYGWRGRLAGFGYATNTFVGGGRSATLALPGWFVALGFAALPSRALLRRRRRPAAGHCPTCNYDLRATPNRCPECGTASADVAAVRATLREPV